MSNLKTITDFVCDIITKYNGDFYLTETSDEEINLESELNNYFFSLKIDGYIKDYIVDNVDYKERNINDPIIIAGNLSPFKVGYLKYLKDIKCNFNLYGVGFDEENKSDNVEYKGKFLPDELVNNLEEGSPLCAAKTL